MAATDVLLQQAVDLRKTNTVHASEILTKIGKYHNWSYNFDGIETGRTRCSFVDSELLFKSALSPHAFPK